jgi:outer membrane protein OmpA-like peptidoglycan-associated protein
VDLQACRSDLQNERLARRDAERQAEASQALVRLLVVQMQARSAASAASASAAAAEAGAGASGTVEATPASNSSRAAQAEAGSASNPDREGACPGRVGDTALGDAGSSAASGNGIYIVRFDFGSARLQMPAALAASLVEEAKQAPLVLLRGRTDGNDDAWGEARIARERAEAVRDYLVGHGVPADRIRSTWQASGDHVADNRSSAGRELNRRVEIEIYRQLPVALNPPQALWR